MTSIDDTGMSIQEPEETLVHEEARGIAHTIRKIRLLFEAVHTSFKLSRADEVFENFRKRGPSIWDKWNEFEKVITTIDRYSFVRSIF